MPNFYRKACTVSSENLRQDSALKAVTGPLTLGYGRQFRTSGVAEKLVKNLMTVELETAIGATGINHHVVLQLERLWCDLARERNYV